MEIQQPSSIGQATALFTGLTRAQVEDTIKRIYPYRAFDTNLHSLNTKAAISATGSHADYREKEMIEAHRLLQGIVTNPWTSIHDIAAGKADPFYFDSGLSDIEDIIQKTIGKPTGAPDNHDPRYSFMDNLLKLKMYQKGMDNDHSYDYMKNLFLTQVEKGSTYYQTQAMRQNEDFSTHTMNKLQSKPILDHHTILQNTPINNGMVAPHKHRSREITINPTPYMQFSAKRAKLDDLHHKFSRKAPQIQHEQTVRQQSIPEIDVDEISATRDEINERQRKISRQSLERLRQQFPEDDDLSINTGDRPIKVIPRSMRGVNTLQTPESTKKRITEVKRMLQTPESTNRQIADVMADLRRQEAELDELIAHQTGNQQHTPFHRLGRPTIHDTSFDFSGYPDTMSAESSVSGESGPRVTATTSERKQLSRMLADEFDIDSSVHETEDWLTSTAGSKTSTPTAPLPIAQQKVEQVVNADLGIPVFMAAHTPDDSKTRDESKRVSPEILHEEAESSRPKMHIKNKTPFSGKKESRSRFPDIDPRNIPHQSPQAKIPKAGSMAFSIYEDPVIETAESLQNPRQQRLPSKDKLQLPKRGLSENQAKQASSKPKPMNVAPSKTKTSNLRYQQNLKNLIR